VYLVFFALAGSRLDPFALVAIAIPVVVLAGARAVVFYLGSRAAGALTHADPVVTRYTWTGLLPQAGLSLALIVSIQNNFAFGAQAAVILLSVLGVNQLVAPILFRRALLKSGEAGRKPSIDL
jgi:hypothetical protein